MLIVKDNSLLTRFAGRQVGRRSRTKFCLEDLKTLKLFSNHIVRIFTAFNKGTERCQLVFG